MTVALQPLLPGRSDTQVAAILGAMQAVGKTGRGATGADQSALGAAARFIFGRPLLPPLADVGPEALSEGLAGTDLAQPATQLLAIMAVIDAPADAAKFEAVHRYAAALGVHARFVEELAEAAQHNVRAALADMVRANMDSILNHPWLGDDALAWLLCYRNAPDPALAARFEALQDLDPDSFGHRYWRHFKRNGFAFPGDPAALNIGFAVPHDSVHVLTGYTTTGHGEILVSTFTSSMHRINPIAGHMLPAIFSWHLDIEINPVAKDFAGALDPVEVWRAWAAGAQAGTDTFAPGWDFWGATSQPLETLRRRWNMVAGGLQPDSDPR